MSDEWIMNPVTNRYVKKGSKTYKLLIKTGVLSDSSNNYADNKSDESLSDNSSISFEEKSSDSEYDKIQYDTLPSNEEIDKMNEDELKELYELLSKLKK